MKPSIYSLTRQDMIDWAEYMSRIDIPEIETITTGGIFETEEIEIIKSYKYFLIY